MDLSFFLGDKCVGVRFLGDRVGIYLVFENYSHDPKVDMPFYVPTNMCKCLQLLRILATIWCYRLALL